MRVQRAISPAKQPSVAKNWAELRHRLQGTAARVRQVWSRRLHDRGWWARACLVVGAFLALAVLCGVGYRAQVHRTLARAVQRGLGRGPYATFAVRARPHKALPSLHLEMAPPASQALAMQRLAALRTGILWPQDAQPVEATLRVERGTSALQRALLGRSTAEVGALVRLAGSRCDGVHPVDQWQESKWSLEVQTSPGAPVLGSERFTLRSPALRGYLDGWLYREALYRAGLLPAQADLVNLVLNGEDWGTYLLEPDLEPAGTAWFESLDSERQGRLLAHADLWEREIPGACQSGADSREQARRLLAEDPAARTAYRSEAEQIARREYVDGLRTVYRRTFARYQRLLGDEFFSSYLEAPWPTLLARQEGLAARADELDWADARPPLTSAETVLPSIQAPAELPSVDEVLARHPFLARSDRAGFLSVKPGDWWVAGDLVLPEGVGLEAGESVSLSFERGAMLVAHGPLILTGSDGAPIRLLPQEEHWAGVRVLQADPATPSVWRYVEVRGVRGVSTAAGPAADRAGLLFYESPITLDRCRVVDSYAAAALALLRAPFEIDDSEFGAASGDLVQARAAQGRISRSAFHDVLGAAVRLEGSAAEIVDLSVQRVQGEGIWAGPESRVDVQGLRTDGIDVALASVGAEARVRDAHVGRASTAGFLAYAQARLVVDGALYEDDSVQALVQEGSEATLDGDPIPAQAFSVEDLRPPVAPAPAMSPLGIRFGPSIWLVGYQLTTSERAPGETIEVILYWRAFAYVDRQYTIFMHVRDAAGEIVAGWDMMPRYNTFPTTDWPLVERIDDAHIVPLPNDLPPGEYTVALGLYDWTTGVRLPAYTRSGESLPDAAVILEKQVTVK